LKYGLYVYIFTNVEWQQATFAQDSSVVESDKQAFQIIDENCWFYCTTRYLKSYYNIIIKILYHII
jgi:hypothetical protein